MTHDEIEAFVAIGLTVQASTDAETVLKSWGTASRPALLSCSDGLEYVVKDHRPAQGIVTEYVAAVLGRILAAPVPRPHLVRVPAQLIIADPFLTAHFQPGTWYGAQWIPDCSERMALDHFQVGDNRSRFAALFVLYSWLGAADHQFIYENASPNRVYSVDHGHFLPNGPAWTILGLDNAPPATLDPFFDPCQLTVAELAAVRRRLARIDDEQILRAVCGPISLWSVGPQERIALANYLIRRRFEVLSLLPGV